MGRMTPDCLILSKALLPVFEPLCDRCGELAHFEVRIPLEVLDLLNAEGWAPRRPVELQGMTWGQLFCCLGCRDELVAGAPQLTKSD